MGRRVASVGLVAVMVLAVPASVTSAASASAPCLVRNLTQDTVGQRLQQMVDAARDGDRLTLRGTCAGPVRITSDITIRGVGTRPVITGLHRYTVVRVPKGARVTLRSIEIRDGGPMVAHRSGGGIRVRGTLILEDSLVTANRATGVMSFGGLVTIRRTTISRNESSNHAGGLQSLDLDFTNANRTVLIDSVVRDNTGYAGGGLFLEGGFLTLVRTRVVGNRAQREGGGLENFTDAAWGSVRIVDSVIRGNRAGTRGGGIDNGGDLVVRGSTITGNAAGRTGGGIDSWGPLGIQDSRITANSAGRNGGGIVSRGAFTVSIDAESSITGNDPNDCVGTMC